jgi:hypothetical protein
MYIPAKKKNIRALLFLMKKNGYVVYTKPYQLNIVGVRSKSTIPNKFDDWLYVFWKDKNGKWVGRNYPITTDPGTYYLKDRKFLSKLGTAILKEGQYVDTYKLDLHLGKYLAMTQRLGPVTVYRDYDRDAVLDFDNGREETGMFGINIHKAKNNTVTNDVESWSAGCQVFQDSKDFDDFMKLAQKHKALYGNKFTYTLFDERAYLRGVRRRGLYVVIGLVVGAALWTGYRAIVNKPIIPKL